MGENLSRRTFPFQRNTKEIKIHGCASAPLEDYVSPFVIQI